MKTIIFLIKKTLGIVLLMMLCWSTCLAQTHCNTEVTLSNGKKVKFSYEKVNATTYTFTITADEVFRTRDNSFWYYYPTCVPGGTNARLYETWPTSWQLSYSFTLTTDGNCTPQFYSNNFCSTANRRSISRVLQSQLS